MEFIKSINTNLWIYMQIFEAHQKKSITMNDITKITPATNTTEKFQLVKNVFTPDEAEDVLLTMVRKKINYHNDLIFSTFERFGEPCSASEERLKALRGIREEISAVAEKARGMGLNLEVNCQIEINLTEQGKNC